MASPDHRTVADNQRAGDVNTEAIDGPSALQGAHVVRPLTVAKYPPTDTTDPVTEGVKIAGDGAYGRLHLHSAYAHVALALSQLLQSGGQVIELGEVVLYEARYESARDGGRIVDLADLPSVFRVRRVTAVVAKVFNHSGVQHGRYFFCHLGARKWSAQNLGRDWSFLLLRPF